MPSLVGGGGSNGGGGGSGTVTSVGLSLPSEFTVAGTPITSAGTLTAAKAAQPANQVFAGPTSGGAAAPAFRALAAGDVSAAVLAALAFGPFTALASAATADLSSVGTIGVNITGTTAITSFGAGANLLRVLKFAGALTLTHNATSLILPGGANITTAAGDTAVALSDGSGNWTVVAYQRASGKAITTTITAADLPAHTGDVTSSAGSAALTIANDAVTYAKMQNVSATDRLLGRDSTGAGDVEELSVGGGIEFTGGGGIQRSALTGDVSVGAGSNIAVIGNDTVTYAKLQDVSASQRLLGRNSASAGDAEEVTASAALDWIGSTRGALLYRGVSAWGALSPGSAGRVFTSSGAGADPAWQPLPWINVKDHGAVGDAVADDTAALQSALDAAVAAGGGIVMFPIGDYKITNTIRPGNDTWLLAVPGARLTANINTSAIQSAGGSASRRYRIRISNLWVDGVSTANTLFAGIDLRNATDCLVENCVVQNGAAGFQLLADAGLGCYYNRLLECVSTGCTIGVYIGALGNENILDGYRSTGDGTPIVIAEGSHNTIDNAAIESWTGTYGINISGPAWYTTIVNPRLEEVSGTKTGIRVISGANKTVIIEGAYITLATSVSDAGTDTHWYKGALTFSELVAALGYTPVNKAGDTMTGALTLSGDPTSNLQAATKQYVDASAGGGGEANTAANIGTAGVGLFKAKVGVELRFKKLNAGSSRITISDDVANDEVDVDVAEAQLALGSIGGSLVIGQIPDGLITYAKLQDIAATDRLLGRDTAGAGDVEELTVGGGIEFTGSGGIQRSALTGDVTAAAGSNATTIANNAVTYAKLQDVSVTDRLLGRDTTGAGDVEELTVGGGIEFTGAGGIQRSALTGDVTASAGSNATTIANDAVTYAKMQNVSATSRMLGRKTAAAGDVEELTLSEALDFVGSAARGDILIRGASTWTRLAVGAAARLLRSDGTDPSWAQVALATDVTGALPIANGGTGLTAAPLDTIFVPASAMITRTTNGAAAGSVELTTNRIMLSSLDFDTTTQEFAQFQIRMPKSWNESTITARFVWSHAATATNFGVVWALEAVAISDDDAGDVAFGTAQQVADTGGTTNDIYITNATSAITIGGTPQAEDWVVFQVKRVPSDGSDTMAIDARLLGVTLYITSDTYTDA